MSLYVEIIHRITGIEVCIRRDPAEGLGFHSSRLRIDTALPQRCHHGAHPPLGHPKLMMYSKVYSILSLLLLAVSAVAGAAPNVIHVIADDFGWTDLSSDLTNFGNGSDFYQTPNIDRLAVEGMAFTSAYALQTCSPTRTAVMTGQYPTRTGVYNVVDIDGDANDLLVGAANNRVIANNATTLAETLQSANYTTAHFGKFHATQSAVDITAEHGFDFDFGGGTSGGPGTYFAAQQGPSWRFGNSVGPGLDPYADPYTQAYVDANLLPYANGSDVNSLVGTPKHLTDATTDAAIDFIQGQATASDPFYMNVAFNAVHTPIESRPDLESKYDAVLTANGGISPDPRHANTGYAGLVEGMDQAIGRLLKAIEDPNGDGDTADSIAGNTLVLFYGDNGGAQQATDNSPLRASKGSQYEGGIRVPLIAWMPGTVASGTSSNEPVHSVDFYPTVVEFAETTTPDAASHPLDGESLGGLLRGEASALTRDAVYFHYPGYQGANVPISTASLRAGDNRMKLMYFYENREFEVYDLNNDLGETSDLADGDMTASEYKLASRAVTQLRQWLDDTGALYPTVRADGSPVPAPQHMPAITYNMSVELDGETTAQINKLGVTLSLAATGDTAAFDADGSGVGVSSSLDTGGAAQRMRVNGSYATPETIEFSFDQDVMLKSLGLSALNTGGNETVVLSLVSGDNPFVGIEGYSGDGFSLSTDSLTFAANSATGMQFDLDFGTLGQDELLLTAGTVLALTADPAAGGGLLLSSISIAEPLSALDRILSDFNLDGLIDTADYALWKSSFGSTTDLRADGNGDGVVDAADYTLWRDNYNANIASRSPSSSIPEPAAGLLLAWLLLTIAAGQRYVRV